MGDGLSRLDKGKLEAIGRGAESPVQQKNERLKLISKILGMLGSSQDGEVLAAAKKAEAKRVELGLSWDDIILGPSYSIS